MNVLFEGKRLSVSLNEEIEGIENCQSDRRYWRFLYVHGKGWIMGERMKLRRQEIILVRLEQD